MQRFEKEKILILIKTENWSSTTTSIVTLFCREVNGRRLAGGAAEDCVKGQRGLRGYWVPSMIENTARKTDSAGSEESSLKYAGQLQESRRA